MKIHESSVSVVAMHPARVEHLLLQEVNVNSAVGTTNCRAWTLRAAISVTSLEEPSMYWMLASAESTSAYGKA
jgi:hypothetical protein